MTITDLVLLFIVSALIGIVTAQFIKDRVISLTVSIILSLLWTTLFVINKYWIV